MNYPVLHPTEKDEKRYLEAIKDKLRQAIIAKKPAGNFYKN